MADTKTTQSAEPRITTHRPALAVGLLVLLGLLTLATAPGSPSPSSSPDDRRRTPNPHPSTAIVAPPPNPDEQERAEAALDRSCEGWKLTFSDGFAGTWVDETDWTIYHSPGHNNNGLRRADAFSVSDGILTITADMIDGQVVSGGMGSVHSQTYGRFEVLARTEVDPSQILSGVVLTWPVDNDWPAGGENDFYETGTGPTREPFHSYIHFPDGTPLGGHQEIVHWADATEWHHLVMEWSPEEIAIWRDGDYIGSVTDPWVIPHVEHKLTVQLDAMKPGDIAGPVKMEVDWVRVYEHIEPEDWPLECAQLPRHP